MSAVVTPAPLTPAPQAEWFLARDGQQFGPLSDPELRKLIDLGHLKPSDLLWREGFPEWRSAKILLPETGLAPKVPAGPSAPATAPAEIAAQQAVVQPAEPQPAEPTQVPIAPPATVAQAQPNPGAVIAPPTAPSQPVPAPPQAQSLAQRAAAAAHAAMMQSPSAPVAAAPVPQARMPATVPLHAAPGPKTAAPQPAPQMQPGHPHKIQPPAPQRPTAPQASMAPSSQPMPQAAPPGYPAPSAPIANPRNVDSARPAPRLGPQAAPKRGKPAAPAGPDFEDDEREVPRAGIGRWIARVAVIAFFIATLSAAGLYAYPHRDSIVAFAKGLMPTSIATAPAKSPLIGFAPTVEATDAALQAAPLWQTLKREFPDWYSERVKEASALSREQKTEAQIADQMMGQVMALRRKHAGDALSATSIKLKGIATSFANNLVRLRGSSVEACHGFITAGETHPAYIKVLGDPVHTGALQAQLTSVFEAVAEGRKVPRVYPQPKQMDYNVVVSMLEKRGWTNADMRLFSDSGSFAKTEPDKMCKMVIDWFQSQLEITDGETQMRLLSDALKPVIAG